MLELFLQAAEGWDQKREEFVYLSEKTIRMEHSLYSISKWESKWKKSFVSSKDKTVEETFDYYKCMALEDVDDAYYDFLTNDDIQKINDYIMDPMTATTIKTANNRPSREIITAEIVYYWMVTLEIPFECQYWHFNKLMALIQVCNIKNQPPKKMTKGQTMAQNRSLNAARRAASRSRG